jgi:hypothetical protein
MAKPATTLFFGIHKGKPISSVPTNYLLWAYAAFKKPRNSIRPVLLERGVTEEQLTRTVERARVLGKCPMSYEKRQPPLVPMKRSDRQLEANLVAQAMGLGIPYPSRTRKAGIPSKATNYFHAGGYR